MNVNLRKTVPLLLGLLVSCPAILSAASFPYLFSDPLRTMPGVIEKGAVLPGDAAPIPQSFQKSSLKPLTLGDAIDMALSNNMNVRGAWADIKMQAAAVGQSYGAYLPEIKGSFSWASDSIHYSDPVYPSISSESYATQGSATVRVFDFGGRAAGRHAAENTLSASLATYDVTLQSVLSAVCQAYFSALSADASLQSRMKIEEISLSILNSSREREAKGTNSQLDTLRADTALAKATLDKNRALGGYQKSLAILKYYIGVPGSVEVALPLELNDSPLGVVEEKELARWLDDAQNSHPYIVSAKKQLEAAKHQLIAVKSIGLPTIDLSGNLYNNTRPGAAITPGSRETTVTLALSVPIFDGFVSTYKVRGAEAAVEKAEASLADTQQQVAMGIIKAHADATSSLRNLEASANLLKSAQNSLETSQRKYNKGAADLSELLSTQSALADAWNERVRALAEWHVSRLLLLANAGKLGRSTVAGFYEKTGAEKITHTGTTP